jgi:hypothetical protein
MKYTRLAVIGITLFMQQTVLANSDNFLSTFFSALSELFSSSNHHNTYSPPAHTPVHNDPPHHASSNPNYSPMQVREYVNNIIASLSRDLSSHMSYSDLEKLKREVRAMTESLGYVSKKETIDLLIASAIVNFVEERARTEAYSRSLNTDFARRFGESMRNNASAHIEQHGFVDAHNLAPFVGYKMERAVTTALVNEYHVPQTSSSSSSYSTSSQPSAASSYSSSTYSSPKPDYQAPAPTSTIPTVSEPLYLSENCCFCLDNFEQDNLTRVILKPCGHDICKACSEQWLSANNTCPTCRTQVQKTEPVYLSEDCCICFGNFKTDNLVRAILKPCGHDMCKPCTERWFAANKTCPSCYANVQKLAPTR